MVSKKVPAVAATAAPVASKGHSKGLAAAAAAKPSPRNTQASAGAAKQPAARPVVPRSRAGGGHKSTPAAAAGRSAGAPTPPPGSTSPESRGILKGISFNSDGFGGHDRRSSIASSITQSLDGFTSNDDSQPRPHHGRSYSDQSDDSQPAVGGLGELKGYGFRHNGRGAPNPSVVHAATAAVAWRRVLGFLRDSPEGATAVVRFRPEHNTHARCLD
jgi:hypothetical protein